jgi:hypothetical protein
MIKFFRKIRQKLLEEGNLKRYLIYAFGEILLVVIGILIALQINNWNEGRKELAKSHEILREIAENLEYNNVQFLAACEALNGTRVHYSPYRSKKRVPLIKDATSTEPYSIDGYISAKDRGAMFYVIKLN